MKKLRKIIGVIVTLCIIIQTVSFTAFAGALSDVSSIINKSLVVAAGSPLYIFNGQYHNSSKAPVTSDNTLLVNEALVYSTLLAQSGGADRYVLPTAFSGVQSYVSTNKEFVILSKSAISISAAQESTIMKLFGVYMSQNGNDTAAGTPLAPVKTLARAANLCADNMSVLGSTAYGNYVLVHGGVYRTASTINLTSAHSGIKVKAFGDGEASFTNSVKIPSNAFFAVQSTSLGLPAESVGNVYCADLSAYVNTAMIAHSEYATLSSSNAYYDLYVSGRRETLARYPDNGWMYISDAEAEDSSFSYSPSRLNKWGASPSAMIYGYFGNDWAPQPIRISSVNAAEKTITLSKRPDFGIKNGQRYYGFNMIEELTVPGEWYIDTAAKKLYYYPNEDFADDNIELAVKTDNVINISGSNITLDGITVEGTRGTALTVSAGINITVNGVTVRHTGQHGITVSTKSTNVTDCTVYDTGASGIRLAAGANAGLIAGDSNISGCHIYDFSKVFRTYNPGIHISGVGNTASHNVIHDAPHTGLQFNGNDNIIEYNEIYAVGKETSDSGAIYCGRNWTTRGNIIRYNYFHDILKDSTLGEYNLSAVYLDDMLCGTTVTDNIFENCSSAVLIGGGRNNTFSGNYMLNCRRGVTYDDRGMPNSWAYSSTQSGGAVHTTMMNLLGNSSYNASVWGSRYAGWTEHVFDVQSQPTTAGYPKNAVVNNNKSYGAYAAESGYDTICSYVTQNGSVTGNIHSQSNYDKSSGFGSIAFANIGNSKTTVAASIYARYPSDHETLSDSSPILSWTPVSGADAYRIALSKNSSMSSPLYTYTVDKPQKQVSDLEAGDYFWQVTALGANTVQSQSAVISFTVSADATYGSYYIKEKFDNYTSGDFTSQQSDWILKLTANDRFEIVQYGADGNKGLKIVRDEANLPLAAESSAKLEFVRPADEKICVSYDVYLLNYRAGINTLGSIFSSSGSWVQHLLTHSSWIYGQTTSGFNLNLASNFAPQNKMTVYREIDITNKTYDITIYKDGIIFAQRTGLTCDGGEGADANFISFSMKNQTPYELYGTTGDAEMIIDNIIVNSGSLHVAKALYTDTVESSKKIKLHFDDVLRSSSVGKSTISVYENGAPLDREQYSLLLDNIDPSVLEIVLNTPVQSGNKYKVVIGGVVSDTSPVKCLDSDYVIEFTGRMLTRDISSDDFSSYSVGTKFNTAGSHMLGNWSISLGEGDSAEIAIDPANGKKALKLVKSKESGRIDVTYDFDSINSGVVTAKLTAKLEHHSKKLFPFPSVRTDEMNDLIKGVETGTYYWKGDTGQTNAVAGLGRNVDYDIISTVDFFDKIASLEMYQDGVRKGGKQQTFAVTKMDYLYFGIQNRNDNLYGGTDAATVDNPDNDGIYWIKGVAIENKVFELSSVNVPNNSVDVNPETKKLVYKMTEAIDASSFSVNDISVSMNDDTVSPADYDVYIDSSDPTSLVLEFKDILAENSAYMIILPDTMTSAGGKYGYLYGGYIHYFETGELDKADKTTVLFDDFSTYSEGTFTGGNGWNVVGITSGDKLEIVNINGNKKLKLTRSESNLSSAANTKAILNFESPVESGTLRVAYDMELANYRGGLSDLMSIQTAAGVNIHKQFTNSSYLYANNTASNNVSGCATSFSKYNGSVITLERFIDITNGKYDQNIYQDGQKKSYYTNKSVNSAGAPARLALEAKKETAYAVFNGTGDAVYIFDNITVEKLSYPTVVSSSVASGSTNVSPSLGSLAVRFVAPINTEAVTKANVAIEVNGTAVSASDYSLSYPNAASIMISFNKALSANSQYTVTVSGVKSGGEAQLVMKAPYVISFTTAADITLTNASAQLSGGSLNVSFRLGNNTGSALLYSLYGVLKNGDRVIDVKSANGTLGTGGTDISFVSGGVGEYEQGMKYHVYVWDGIMPLTEAFEINLTN